MYTIAKQLNGKFTVHSSHPSAVFPDLTTPNYYGLHQPPSMAYLAITKMKFFGSPKIMSTASSLPHTLSNDFPIDFLNEM